jgi:hypothetical protein
MNTLLQTIGPAELFLPLLVGVATTVVTLFIHGFFGRTMAALVSRAFRRGLGGIHFRIDGLVIAFAAMILLTAHLLEVTLWAAVTMLSGEIYGFVPALYYPAGKYTTLGSGEVVTSIRWRLTGPLEALDGMLLMGISTALLSRSSYQRIGRLAHPEIWTEPLVKEQH